MSAGVVNALLLVLASGVMSVAFAYQLYDCVLVAPVAVSVTVPLSQRLAPVVTGGVSGSQRTAGVVKHV